MTGNKERQGPQGDKLPRLHICLFFQMFDIVLHERCVGDGFTPSRPLRSLSPSHRHQLLTSFSSFSTRDALQEHIDSINGYKERKENVEQMSPESLKHAFANLYEPCGTEKVAV